MILVQPRGLVVPVGGITNVCDIKHINDVQAIHYELEYFAKNNRTPPISVHWKWVVVRRLTRRPQMKLTDEDSAGRTSWQDLFYNRSASWVERWIIDMNAALTCHKVVHKSSELQIPDRAHYNTETAAAVCPIAWWWNHSVVTHVKGQTWCKLLESLHLKLYIWCNLSYLKTSMWSETPLRVFLHRGKRRDSSKMTLQAACSALLCCFFRCFSGENRNKKTITEKNLLYT